MENRPKGEEKPVTMNIKGQSVPTPKTQETMPQRFSANIVNPFVVHGIRKVNIDSNLKPDYSFDSYVEGESNKFAATVADPLQKTLEQQHSTLYFYMEVMELVKLT